MTILSKAEMKLALRDTVNDSLDETVYALYAALEAWVKVAHMAPTDDHDEYIAAHAAAMEATEVAGIKWDEGVWEIEGIWEMEDRKEIIP